MKHKILPGALVVVGLLAAVEVGLRIIADAHTDPNIRLYALAISGAAGVLVGVLRGGGAAVVLLAVSLAAGSAHAGDRSRSYPVTISTAACPTGTPGVLADNKEAGMALAGLRFWNLTVCPASNQTITGAGTLRACVFRRSPSGPNLWVLSPTFYWDMEDDGTGTAITSTSSNRCVTFPDIQLGVNDGDLLYVYPSTDFGVSGGTTVTIYLEGVL